MTDSLWGFLREERKRPDSLIPDEYYSGTPTPHDPTDTLADRQAVVDATHRALAEPDTERDR